jgi:RNA-directed DNA polymerase
VEVLYSEGKANHTGPKPCVSAREGRGEASAGDGAGRPLSRERCPLPSADSVTILEGNTMHRVNASGASTRRGQRHRHAPTLFDREPGDLLPGLRWRTSQVRVGKAQKLKPATNGQKKSDLLIVAAKSANESRQLVMEWMEPSGRAEGNACQSHTGQIQSWETVSQGLARIRKAARNGNVEQFTSLLHHISIPLLEQAYYWLKRDASAGVDGTTWAQYGEGLRERLTDLHARVHNGSYRAQPSRRVHIPKPDGSLRPLGIAALEDKIVQRALVEVLNAIYEVDFLGFSYGFRPGRGQHDALDALAVGIEYQAINWIVDADIRAFFDSIDHKWMMQFLKHRIGDRRVLRLIRKWLKAGVMEGDTCHPTEKGTPQGAVISPLLANIYLHYVYDLWVQKWRQRQTQGAMIVVRYADDTVVGFERKEDAERFLAELRTRLEKFALELHPGKTRLIEFGKNAIRNRKDRGDGKPETFDFLGFTHICTQRKMGGGFKLTRHTRRDRKWAKLQKIAEALRHRRHWSIAEQGKWLGSVIRGFFAYHAVPTNSRALKAFRHYVTEHWRRALRKRSQKDRTTWDDMDRLQEYYLPRPHITHPWPYQRFRVNHPRWEPYAGIPPVRICAGGDQ